jgi:hypothetical protein
MCRLCTIRDLRLCILQGDASLCMSRLCVPGADCRQAGPECHAYSGTLGARRQPSHHDEHDVTTILPEQDGRTGVVKA